jgi:hypothetical protein
MLGAPQHIRELQESWLAGGGLSLDQIAASMGCPYFAACLDREFESAKTADFGLADGRISLASTDPAFCQHSVKLRT